MPMIFKAVFKERRDSSVGVAWQTHVNPPRASYKYFFTLNTFPGLESDGKLP